RSAPGRGRSANKHRSRKAHTMTSPTVLEILPPLNSLWRRFRRPRAGARPRRASGPCRGPLEALEGRVVLSAGLHPHHAANQHAVAAATDGYTGPIYHGIDYNPTWPYWSSLKPTLTVTRRVNEKTIEFTYVPGTMPWGQDGFVGDHL